MRCPFCQSKETRVIDSRLVADGEQIKRRRLCENCEARFNTLEIVQLKLPNVKKNDGTIESFNEEKLRNGILQAIQKRSVTSEQIEVAIAKIKRELRAKGERDIESRIIGELVINQLRLIDQVAYVRFASVYRSFEDVQEFREEIERLEKDLPGLANTEHIDWLRKKNV